MNKIIPTILTADKKEMVELIRTAETFTNYVQIDIMDGVFAPSKSVTASDIKELALEIDFEVDMMVNNPRLYIADLADSGALELDFYLESEGDNMRDLISEAKDRGMKVGVTTLPGTPLTAMSQYADKIDSVRFFSGHLGYYGGEFNESVLPKIREARLMWPNMTFGIDGGVSLENIKKIKDAGINWFAVGSRIMKTENPAESYKQFVAAIS